MRGNKGFTLVEILIVVVILGILAAIVIPQFTNASVEAKNSALAGELQTMRSQLELFKIQHNEQLPGCGNADFFECMFKTSGGETDVDGDIWVDGTSTGNKYGPYMQKQPVNQFNGSDDIRIDGDAVPSGAEGWRYDSTTGEFQANDDYDGDGDGVADHSLL